MDDEYIIVPLPDGVIRKGFSCGIQLIDNFVKNNAARQHKNGQVRVHAAVHVASNRLIGFVSLCLKTYEPDLSEESKELFERVQAVPTVYIAMIGVTEEFQKKGIGGNLLWYAFEKSVEIANIAGTYALTLNANDESLCEYYQNLDFIRMSEDDETRIMYIPISKIREAIAQAGSEQPSTANSEVANSTVA